jgi:hypothetical protein
MVGHASYAIGLTVKVFGDAINIGIEFFLVLYGNCLFSMVCAEDNVEVGCSIAHVKLVIVDILV